MPLGLLAENLVIWLTGMEDNPSVFELIQAHPTLQAHGLVEEMYKDLKRGALRIDQSDKGNWPLLLRALTIPLTDQVYYKRSSHMIPKASSKLGRLLLQRLEMLSGPKGRMLLGD